MSERTTRFLGTFPPCFGYFNLGSEKCNRCPRANSCMDRQAGWGISTFLSDLGGTIEVEKLSGGVPPWVLEWDEMSPEELETMKKENPGMHAHYQRFNSGVGVRNN